MYSDEMLVHAQDYVDGAYVGELREDWTVDHPLPRYTGEMYPTIAGLSHVLRDSVIQISHAIATQENRGDKVE